MSPCRVSVGAIKNAAYAAAANSSTTSAAPKALFIMPLFLQKIFAEKPQRRQKNDIKNRQKSHAFPLHERLNVQQAGGDLRAGHQHRGEQRQEEQRKQQLPHARLRGNSRKCRTCNGNAQTAKKKYQQQLRKYRQNRHVVQNREHRKHQQFRHEKKKRVGRQFRQQNRKRIADRQPQRAQRIVVLLAKKARLQHQRCGKQKRQPQQPGAKSSRFRRRRIKRKAEQHDDHQNKNDRGHQQFARTKLRPQFFAEQHRGIGKQRHSVARKRQGGADIRAAARVRYDGAGV